MSQIAKLTARLKGLKGLEASLSKLLLAMGNLYTAEKPKQLRALTSAMTKVGELRQHKVNGTARLLDSCINELTSLREGLFTGAVSSRDKKELMLSTCSRTIVEIKALIARTEQRIKIVSSEDDEGNSAVLAAEEDDQLLRVINKNSKLRDSLPAIGDKAYVVGRAPVVVVTNAGNVQRKGQAAPFVNHETLVRQGFKVDVLDGYAVIHGQLVIGISRKKKEDLEEEEGAKKKRKPNPMDPLEMARVVAKHLQQVTKKNLEFVITASFSYNGATWFWVMPQAELNQFSKAFPGGRVKLQTWGFAFN